MASSKIKFDFKPFKELGINVKRSEKRKVLREIVDYLLNQVPGDMDSQRSSVSGRQWKGLSKEYASRKGSNKADLELTGKLKESFSVSIRDNNTVRVEFTDQDKADGHNNFSGKSKLPLRQSIPNESKDQTFRRGILKDIEEIIGDGGDEE
jgi:hypothetical protein